MKRYLKIGITGAAILASGILCAFVLFKMPVIISVLKGITEIFEQTLVYITFLYFTTYKMIKIQSYSRRKLRTPKDNIPHICDLAAPRPQIWGILSFGVRLVRLSF